MTITTMRKIRISPQPAARHRLIPAMMTQQKINPARPKNGKNRLQNPAPPESQNPTMRNRKTPPAQPTRLPNRSEEHTSELQSLMRLSYAVFCLKQKHQPQLHRHYLICTR